MIDKAYETNITAIYLITNYSNDTVYLTQNEEHARLFIKNSRSCNMFTYHAGMRGEFMTAMYNYIKQDWNFKVLGY